MLTCLGVKMKTEITEIFQTYKIMLLFLVVTILVAFSNSGIRILIF
jgi:hypothetical protein